MEGEWQSVLLGDVADLLTGYPFKSKYYTNDENDPRLVGGDNIVQGRLRWDNVRRWPRAMVEGLNSYWLRPGDVLLAMDRPWIDAGLKRATVGTGDLPALLIQRTARIRGGNRLDTGFLRYVISSPAFTQYVLGVQTGTTIPHISPAQIRAFRFLLAPLTKQRAIARILGALDDKIELNRKMNETLEAMARALFKSWFVDFDPVRAKAQGRPPSGMDAETAKLFPNKLVDSELGPIPHGWRIAKLVELTTKIGSGATPRGGDKAYVDEGVAFIRSQNVYDSAFTWSGLVYITDDEANRLAGVTVREEDVLLNITGASILRTCVVEPSVLPARVNQHVAIVRSRPGIPSRFIHNHLLMPETKGYLIGMDAGASRQAVTKGHIESVLVVEPPSDILAEWQNHVEPLYTYGTAMRCESQTLARLRDTLLPRLLSGELSVAAAERAVEQVA